MKKIGFITFLTLANIFIIISFSVCTEPLHGIPTDTYDRIWVDSVNITRFPDKREYFVGGTFDFKGLEVTVKMKKRVEWSKKINTTTDTYIFKDNPKPFRGGSNSNPLAESQTSVTVYFKLNWGDHNNDDHEDEFELTIPDVTVRGPETVVFSDFTAQEIIAAGGAFYIINYSGNGGNITIPAQIDGKPITGISQGVFAGKQLTGVIIPDGITCIGGIIRGGDGPTFNIDGGSTISEGAFENNQLTSVTIPDSVTSIGVRAFANNQLASVTIPDSVTSIGDDVFANNQLTSVTIPNSVTAIWYNAFENNQLTSVVIPARVQLIRGNAFANNQLASVTIPNSVTSIGEAAFYQNQLTSVTIPESVTFIGVAAFENNQLTSVTIPYLVRQIGWHAFYGNQLTSITIGRSQVELGLYSNDGVKESFGSGFDSFYNDRGKEAGTYIFTENKWTKQN